MRQIIIISSLFLSLSVFGQLRLKEVTEYFPNSKQVKRHYFYTRPNKTDYQGAYEVYYANGKYSEQGYFENGKKVAYMKFSLKGQLKEELNDSITIKNEYFSNGTLKETQAHKMGKACGTWQSYRLNECDDQILVSSIEYQNQEIKSSTTTIDSQFYGAFSINRMVTTNNQNESDTTIVTSYCKPDISYPARARFNNIQGWIYVKVELSSNCQLSYNILNELGFGIEEEVGKYFEKLKQSYFENKIGCQDYQFTMPFHFALN
jgi:antitoxin component YwqK of YwqJK toxin-antitoxin module